MKNFQIGIVLSIYVLLFRTSTGNFTNGINNYGNNNINGIQFGKNGKNYYSRNSVILTASSKSIYDINGKGYEIECFSDGKCTTYVFDYDGYENSKTQNGFSRSQICTDGVCTTCNGKICIIHDERARFDPYKSYNVYANKNKGRVVTQVNLIRKEIQQTNGRNDYSYCGPKGVYNESDGRTSYAGAGGTYNTDSQGDISYAGSKGTYKTDGKGRVEIRGPNGSYTRDAEGNVNYAGNGATYNYRSDGTFRLVQNGVIREFDGKIYSELGHGRRKSIDVSEYLKTGNTDGLLSAIKRLR